jgi:hypothetical protein
MSAFFQLLGDAIALLAFACVIYILSCMFIRSEK